MSSSRQAESGLGVDAQLEACRAYAGARGWPAGDEVIDHCSGAVDPDKRAGLGPALQGLDFGGGVLVTAALSRLARRARDCLDLADRARTRGWHLVALDLQIDTTSAAGRLVLTTLAGLAQYERDVSAERTSQALAQARRRGVRLGRPVETPEESRARLRELRAQGLSMRETARQLNQEGAATARGGAWHRSTVRRLEESDRLDREAELYAAAAGARP